MKARQQQSLRKCAARAMAFVQLLASHVRSAGRAAESALQRVAALERSSAAAQQLPVPLPRSPSPGALRHIRSSRVNCQAMGSAYWLAHG